MLATKAQFLGRKKINSCHTAGTAYDSYSFKQPFKCMKSLIGFYHTESIRFQMMESYLEINHNEMKLKVLPKRPKTPPCLPIFEQYLFIVFDFVLQDDSIWPVRFQPSQGNTVPRYLFSLDQSNR